MFIQSKKLLSWDKKDFAKIIGIFLLNYIILDMLYVVAIILNLGSIANFEAYFIDKSNIRSFVFMMLSLALILVVIFLFYYYEARNFIKQPRNSQLIFLIFEISLVISYLVGKWGDVYARPIALCALLSLLLIDRKTAIFMNVVMCIFVFLLDHFTAFQYAKYSNVEFSALVIGFCAGLIAIYLVSGITSRIKVFFKGFIVSIPIVLSMFFLESSFSLNNIIIVVLTGVTSGVLSVVLLMALLPLFEFLFNALTDYRLAEITDHKFKPIKHLIEKAPGTFNHSLIVSNLAESCATAIGENSQLARAAAYYHDFGKLKQPGFFTENQTGYNPHEELSPELSTDIIRSHARDGYDMIKKYHLPEILADVAIEHHGTLPIRYFYHKACKFTDGELNVEDYSYGGPKPQSKISAIIMIADASEAKVRTLADRTHEKVDKSIKEIIEERMDADQFSECEITMSDLSIIRNTIANSLAGVYHDRVQYPKLKIGRKNGNG